MHRNTPRFTSRNPSKTCSMTGVLEEVVEQRVFLAFSMYRVYGIAKSMDHCMDEGDAILDCRCHWRVAGIFYSLHCRDLSLSTTSLPSTSPQDNLPSPPLTFPEDH